MIGVKRNPGLSCPSWSNRLIATVLLLPIATIAVALTAEERSKAGEKIATSVCNVCHQAGIAGAPRTGNPHEWKARMEKGMPAVLENAVKGFNGMPPKGGNPNLTREQLTWAIEWMAGLPAKGEQSTTDASTMAPAKKEEKPVADSKPNTEAQNVVAANNARVAAANTFNRLMRSPGKRNPPPAQDGIHDVQNPGTELLQHPKEAFAGLPQSNSGNYVNWVGALALGHITPRYHRDDENAKPIVMDLNIVREVKGSMPDVVYPHKQHTEWLDCSNCHPAIFIPKKGENVISMASILLGEKCGVCHGKVAFPVAECRRCHSRGKQPVSVSTE